MGRGNEAVAAGKQFVEPGLETGFGRRPRGRPFAGGVSEPLEIRGGIAHGVGNALFEQMIYDDECQPLTTTFADYLLPTAPELPRFETLYRDTPSPINPLGAKGVGEVGTIPVAAAIISAIEDALAPFDIRIQQTPVLPETLFNLISAARAQGLPRL